MRLSKLSAQGIIPILPLLGILIMFIGIAVAIQLARQGPETQSRAQTPPTNAPVLSPTPSPSAANGTKRTFSDLLVPQ